jgi:hypothetical protein
LMYIAANNTLTDSVDIGFIGAKNTSGTFSHTGLARDATDGKYKLFDGLPDNDHIGNVINFANTYLATLVANVEANTLRVVNSVTGNVNFDSGTLFVDSVNDRVGVGTTTPSYKLHVAGTGYTSGNFTSGGIIETLTTVQSSSGSDLSLNANGANRDVFFKVNSSTLAMVQGSTGNFGVGTSSPLCLMHVGSGSNTVAMTGTVLLSVKANGASAGVSAKRDGYAEVGIQSGGGGGYVGTYTNDVLNFVTNGVSNVRATIDTSGNFGIGTTSPTAKLDVRTAAGSSAQFNLYSGNNSTITKISIGQIAAIDWDIGLAASTGHFYIGGLGGTVSEAYRIQRTGTSIDNHRWSTGAAVERMFINSSGILILGNTASSGTTGGAIFNIKKPIDSGASVNYAIHINDPATNTSGGVNLIGWSHNSNDYTDVNVRAAIGATIDGGGAGSLVFRTGTYSSQSERMRIDSSGNVGIGVSSPQQRLHISGNNGIGFGGSTSDKKLYSPLDGDLEWMTHNAASGKGFAVSHQGTKYVYLSVSGVSYLTGGGFSVGTTANPGTGAIYATGDITAFYSDDRLKTKLGNIDGALNKVLSLNGFYFEPNETAINLGYEVKKQVGVSAQEVQAVLPEVVVPAPIDQEYMTVHYHKIVPLLIEAIKELNEKIEKLTK